MKPFIVQVFISISLLTMAGVDVQPKKDPIPESKVSAHEPMNNQRLENILKRHAKIQEGQLGYWSVAYAGHYVLVITDETHNRMRIISPIIEAKNLSEADLRKLMEANFESALDARYAIYNEVLWSVFIHPLGELNNSQFLDGLKQTVQLAASYGTTYSSTEVILSGQE